MPSELIAVARDADTGQVAGGYTRRHFIDEAERIERLADETDDPKAADDFRWWANEIRAALGRGDGERLSRLCADLQIAADLPDSGEFRMFDIEWTKMNRPPTVFARPLTPVRTFRRSAPRSRERRTARRSGGSRSRSSGRSSDSDPEPALSARAAA
jgi:hypothetical protein